MTFIRTVRPADASGDVRDMYERQEDHWGFVPNYAKAFSHRPEALARWGRLLAELRRPTDDRRFELVTFAAAHALRNRMLSATSAASSSTSSNTPRPTAASPPTMKCSRITAPSSRSRPMPKT